MIVDGAQKLAAAGASSPRPLTYGDVLLYPNLGQPVRPAPGRAVTFFLTAWPAAERPSVEARVEVARGGRTIVSAPAAQLQPGADGRIQLASSVPIESLPPGSYELRVHLTDGQDEETRTAVVPIGPLEPNAAERR
jgi:hypothetical protein